MEGFDEKTTALALAKQLLMDCEGSGDITVPRGTLKIILVAFSKSWHDEQNRKRSELKKAAV